jgi:gamma-glutamylcyclotransferase (GGCT)/AIG2-like uncharacterized protein YtfP
MNHLFVYGTLRSRFQNRYARMLAEEGRLLGGAQVLGRLYDLGRYPGMEQSSAPEERVAGELYELRDGALTLGALDEYEGAEFTRVTATVHLESGEQMAAWVYVYNRPVAGERRILSGDYLADK